MASMCVEIHTTRAIAPQILRHRSFSFQEFSQRYAVAIDARLYCPATTSGQKEPSKLYRRFTVEERAKHYYRINDAFEEGICLYEDMLADGVAKECARAVSTIKYCDTSIYVWHYSQLATLCRPAW